jgi:hypothetical protein
VVVNKDGNAFPEPRRRFTSIVENTGEWPTRIVKEIISVHVTRQCQTVKNVAMSPVGLGTRNNCAGEGQQQFSNPCTFGDSFLHETLGSTDSRDSSVSTVTASLVGRPGYLGFNPSRA